MMIRHARVHFPSLGILPNATRPLSRKLSTAMSIRPIHQISQSQVRRLTPRQHPVSPILASHRPRHNLLMPRKMRSRKAFKGYARSRLTGSLLSTKVVFGTYGLRVLETCRITAKQIETIRQAIRRQTRSHKSFKLYIKIFPHRPVTSKGAESRMGKGKGAVSYYATWVSKNTVCFELGGVMKEVAIKAFNSVKECLPARSEFVEREIFDTNTVREEALKKKPEALTVGDVVAVNNLKMDDLEVDISNKDAPTGKLSESKFWKAAPTFIKERYVDKKETHRLRLVKERILRGAHGCVSDLNGSGTELKI